MKYNCKSCALVTTFMASSGGITTTASTSSGSDEDLQQLMDQRKRKRMISNRESARRSRMRKQMHLDDLMAQVAQLKKENNIIITKMSVTTQLYLNVEAENSILRAQIAELTNRLQYFTEITGLFDAENGGFGPDYNVVNEPAADLFMFSMNNNPMKYFFNANQQQPIMASVDY